VRRVDPVWGKQSLAKRANDDTFHYTNCSPQHKNFNEQGGVWFNLEQHVQKQAKGQRFNVLGGPVFGANDPLYRGVLIPLQFWKIIAYLTDKGALAAAGFLLSQEEDVAGIPLEGLQEEGFSPGKFVTEQRPIRYLAQLTKLDFGPLVKADALADTPDEALFTESAEGDRPLEITDLSQIVLTS
jgi:endonuclease G